MPAIIKAISYYLPEKKFSNEDFGKIFPDSLSDANLKKLGIKERRIVGEHQTASDLAVESALQLFKEHDIDKNEIDFILFCAQEFDHYTPTTACLIQERLEIPTHCGALDFNLGCSGYIYGLSLAKGLIDACGSKNVLLLTSSTLTKTFHPKDKSSRYIFGDGAAATIINNGPNENNIGPFVFGTDGKRGDKIIIKDGGARNTITIESNVDFEDDYGNITNNAHFFMNGTSIFNFGLKTVPKMVEELLIKAGLKIDQIDLFIFHQTNNFMNDMIRKKIGIPEEKFVVHIENCGNTVSSTIPIALHESIRIGKAKKGQIILLAAFGTGLSWAATIIRL
ncbi:MAG TPA: ketoacyl-ACP synthase III [Bacteroidia bacterium]|nr:ketoacyl-ACP synthase III [Bacteroidia bacterium]